jgi:5-methylcytosine-specific restriction enzyme A
MALLIGTSASVAAASSPGISRRVRLKRSNQRSQAAHRRVSGYSPDDPEAPTSSLPPALTAHAVRSAPAAPAASKQKPVTLRHLRKVRRVRHCGRCRAMCTPARERTGAPLMPRAIRRACRSGCPHFQPCPVHGRSWARARVLSSAKRGYGSQHRALRLQTITEEPHCRACGIRPSTIADHIVPLSLGGQTVRANLQGLCTQCSRAKTGREGAAARATFTSGLVARPKEDGSPVKSRPSARDLLPPPHWATR